MTPPAAITPRWQPRREGETPVLAAGEIHLWAVDLASARLATRGEMLSKAEHARAARYRDPAARQRYLGGRVGMRLLLSAYTGLANAALDFGAGKRGKPVLRNRLGGGELCFNYSLSRGWALYALAWERQLGVDLETHPRQIAAKRLARRKLTAAERQAWQALPAASAQPAMLACWTRKEAYGKALGVGIRYHMNRVSVFADTAARWECVVGGLFEAGDGGGSGSAGGSDGINNKPPTTNPTTLHGIQFTPPCQGIAALVHSGGAVPHNSLQTWCWT